MDKIEKALKMIEKIFDGEIVKRVNENGFNYANYYIKKYNKIIYIQEGDFFGIDYTIYQNYGLHKQQCCYTKTTSLENLEKELKSLKFDKMKPLKNTHKQYISYDLFIIEKGKTKYNILLNIAGFREKNILNNLLYITINEQHNDRDVITFYDKNNNGFMFDCSNNTIAG